MNVPSLPPLAEVVSSTPTVEKPVLGLLAPIARDERLVAVPIVAVGLEVFGSNMTTPLPTNLTGNASGTTANLAWTAGVGAKVDVYRDGVKIKTGIANTGATTDTGRTVGTSSVYQVCNTAFSDAANCSNTVMITF